MKKQMMLGVGLMFLSAGAFAADKPKASMDPLDVAPGMYVKRFENNRVRVMEVTIPPGGKIAKHTHPDHYVYVLEGGSVRISKAEGSTDVNFAAGQVVWIAAETHWAENTGKTTVRLLVNELK